MLIRHTLAYLVARGIPGLINFAAVMLYTRLLTPDDYGRYALVIAGISMVGVIVFQWQRLVVARWLPARKEDPQRFLGETLRIFALLALIVGAIGAALVLMWPDPVWQRLLALAILLLIAQSWVEFNLIIAAAQLSPTRYGWLLGTKTALAVLIGVSLAWAGFGPYAPLLGLLVGCTLAVPLFGRTTWRGIKSVWPQKSLLSDQLRYGLPLIVTFALGWVIASSDRFLISWLLSVEAAGQYAVAYDLAQHSLGMLLAIVQVAAYPLAVQALEERGPAAATAQVKRNGELIMGLALASGVGLAVLAPQIANVVVGNNFRAVTAKLLPLIALAAAIGGVKAFHFDIAFHLGRNSRGLVLSVASAAVANIGLNLMLIPRFGILGSAYATVLAYSLGAATSIWLGRKAFLMPSPIASLLRSGVVALAVWFGAATGGMAGQGVGGLLAGTAMGATLGIIVAFIVDLAGIKDAARSRLSASASSSEL